LKVIAGNQNISDLHLSAGEMVADRVNGEVIRKEEMGKM
jgi:Tfp pilus assembly pilus retraction ATPase PilT